MPVVARQHASAVDETIEVIGPPEGSRVHHAQRSSLRCRRGGSGEPVERLDVGGGVEDAPRDLARRGQTPGPVDVPLGEPGHRVCQPENAARPACERRAQHARDRLDRGREKLDEDVRPRVDDVDDEGDGAGRAAIGHRRDRVQRRQARHHDVGRGPRRHLGGEPLRESPVARVAAERDVRAVAEGAEHDHTVAFGLVLRVGREAVALGVVEERLRPERDLVPASGEGASQPHGAHRPHPVARDGLGRGDEPDSHYPAARTRSARGVRSHSARTISSRVASSGRETSQPGKWLRSLRRSEM